MVKVWFAALALSLTVGAWAEDTSKSTTPTFYGSGSGRVWKWSGGKKTEFTPEAMNLTLGGGTKDLLWGWKTESDQVRFFTLPLPKKDARPGAPVFDKALYPVPVMADRVGDRLLLVYATASSVRWEVWRQGMKIASEAYEDRAIYAVALGPKEGWMVAGGMVDGTPWLNASGVDISAPEGWRGRLAVTVWLGGDKSPAIPMAAGWGTAGTELPQILFWEPDGWTQPAPEADSKDGASGELKKGDRAQTVATEAPVAAVYPVVGTAGEKGLVLGGWQRSANVTRLWFWDGKADVPGGSADGEIQALSLTNGKTLIVKHRAPPWFTLEDGKTSMVLEGLGENDKLVLAD